MSSYCPDKVLKKSSRFSPPRVVPYERQNLYPSLSGDLKRDGHDTSNRRAHRQAHRDYSLRASGGRCTVARACSPGGIPPTLTNAQGRLKVGQHGAIRAKRVLGFPTPGTVDGETSGACEERRREDVAEHRAYAIAKAGGRHAGLLRVYRGKSTAEIQRALRSYERQVELHRQKLANPEQVIGDWHQRHFHVQRGLLRHWHEDLARNQELAEVMRGILQERGSWHERR
jgi:hypothetical protein